jgi:hypothetical protein
MGNMGFGTPQPDPNAQAAVAQVDQDPYNIKVIANASVAAVGLSQGEANRKLESTPTPLSPTFATPQRSSARIRPRVYSSGGSTGSRGPAADSILGPESSMQSQLLVSRRNLRTLSAVDVPDVAEEEAAAGDTAPASPAPEVARSPGVGFGFGATAPEQPQEADDDLPQGPPQLDRKHTPYPAGLPDLPTGYHTYPAWETLRNRSRADLKAVENFKLKNDHGEIAWLEPVDLTEADFDDITIADGAIDAMSNEDTRPAVGSGLNKPASVTLFRVFPKNKGASEKFRAKLEAAAKQFGAVFKSYDADEGRWSFELPHF